MTYLPELRNALLDAAHRQPAEPEPTRRGRAFKTAPWHRTMHSGRAILASVVLGLTGTAVGAVQVGPPLGPEPQLSYVIANPASPPATTSSRP
jgi:hypothetical protein